MSARHGPGDADRRPPEGERRIGERLGGRTQSRTERQQVALRRALHDARRRQDGPSVALLLAWLRDAA